MRITDELRSWFEHAYTFSKDEVIVRVPNPWFGWKPNLEQMLDRIDAEHKAAVDKAHADGERNGLQQARSASEDWQRGFDEGFAAADDWLAEHEDAMVEHGWVKLPVDADGVPIRVGDEVKEVGYNVNGTVCELRMDDDGWWVFVNGVGRRPGKYRHYHAPTVEDVLTKLEGMRGGYATYEDVVTRCAELAKTLRELLQLKDVDA